MNKMISYLFWISALILFLLFALSLNDSSYGFFLPIKDEIIKFDLPLVLLLVSIYSFIIGLVFIKIKTKHHFLTLFGFFTIISTFLFFNSMIDHKLFYQEIEAGNISPDIFATRTTIFFIVSSIWLFAQTIFWFKVIIHFFNLDEAKLELLDDAKY